MNDIAPITAVDGEVIAGGEPTFPAVVTISMFGRVYPLMHGSAVYVQSVSEFSGILLAIGHPELQNGMFMGLSPDQARNVATWLLSTADEIDSGKGKQ